MADINLGVGGANSAVAGGYDIANSLKTQANAGNEWFYRSSPTTGNKRTFTFSFWIKRTQLTGFEADPYLMSQGTNARFHFAGDTLRFMFDGGTTELEASAVLRDTSAWYHVVLAVDTTQSTAANRVKAYLNGQDYDWNNTKYPTQNQEGSWMSGTSMYFNTRDGDGSYDNSGYWSEVVVVDGQQLDPTSFGEFDEDSGIWKPKDLSDLTFGSEGFYYKFDNASSLGEDSSGNGNDATLNNITSADQATDTPTNNFAIGNILTSVGGFLVPTEGATKGVLSTSGPGNNTAGASLFSTIPVSNGKWYFEAQNTNSGDVYLYLGVGDVGGIENWGIDGKRFGSPTGPSVGWRGGGAQDGKVYINNVATGSANTWETEVVGVALDLDNNKVYFHKSGTYINSGDPANGTDNGGQYDLPTAADDQWCIGVSAYNLATWLLNFGGYTTISISTPETDANGYGTFEYAPPSGYYALCTKNLAEYG